MEMDSMLELNSVFAGFKIVEKLSKNHDGEREVYLASDVSGEKTVLTVFNLETGRYAFDEDEYDGESLIPAEEFRAEIEDPDSIAEIAFLHKYASTDWSKEATDSEWVKNPIPLFLDCGIETLEVGRYAWMTQEYIRGVTVEGRIRENGTIPLSDACEIVRRLSMASRRISLFAEEGGHYNITPDNILLRYDGDSLIDVHLVGFTYFGPPCQGKSHPERANIDSDFRAPETLKGIYTHYSDQYSIGLVTMAMLTGLLPHSGAEAYKKDFFGFGGTPPSNYQFRLIKTVDAQMHRQLSMILNKAVSIIPINRFPTIDKFYAFLSAQDKSSKESSSDEDTKKKGTDAMEKYINHALQQGLRPLKVVNKHAARFQEKGNPKALDDVAGMSELKALFRRDFIRIIRNPDVANAYGIRPTNCMLLYGPQGCGKTLIAEKAAQESGLKYRIISPSELGSIFIHGAQQKIAELFKEAEKKGPMIFIFDEFDAIVPKRDSDLDVHQAGEVNEMLTQLNNCASRGIYVLATTNRPTLLDPAIMRKGRIDRMVYVPLPDKEARKELFRIQMGKRPHLELDYDVLAAATDNYAGSDITYIVEECARRCFETTLDDGLEDPIPLSMDILMEVIKETHPSVSEDQRREFLALREKMEHTQKAARRRVGY